MILTLARPISDLTRIVRLSDEETRSQPHNPAACGPGHTTPRAAAG
jgi:hypothetical protein